MVIARGPNRISVDIRPGEISFLGLQRSSGPFECLVTGFSSFSETWEILGTHGVKRINIFARVEISLG